MKKFFGFIGLAAGIFLITQSAIGSTNVSGVISTNTVWNTAGSPYIVTGNVLVDTLIKLTIQAGVEVRFDSAKCIMVKGTLNAIGTVSDSIIITKNGTASWSRLWLKPASYCSLQYCRIEYAGNSAIFNEAANLLPRSIYIGYCTISHNSTSSSNGAGIYTQYGSAIITHNTISNNATDGKGGGIYNESAATISNNIITNNSSPGGYGGGGGGIYNGGLAEIVNNTITNNSTGSANAGGGIHSYYGGVRITGNTITGNTAWGSAGGGIYANSAIITHNTISNNGAASGGGIFSESSDSIIHNTISNNSASQGGSICSNASSYPIRYNTIIDTTSSAIYTNSATPLIRTNNISATGYIVYNGSTNNVDARYNYWGTTNTGIIDTKIFDYYDDFNKGIVHYQPLLSTVFSDTVAPLAAVNLTANGVNPSPWTNDSIFAINWANPVDPSGIAEYFYKLAPDTHSSSAPGSDFDTTGSLHYPADTLKSTNLQGRLYVWLVDSSGNVDYKNHATVDLRCDTIAPYGPTGIKVNGNLSSVWTDDSAFIVTWDSSSYGDPSGISRGFYKFSSPPTGHYDTTGSLPRFGGTIYNTQQGIIPIFIWLRDSAGNVEYNSMNSSDLRYDAINPAAPESLFANDSTPSRWTTDSVFSIRYVESITQTKGDTSGIVLALYKLGSAPSSNYDTTGTVDTNPFSVICAVDGGETLWVWLKDGTGNLSYNNCKSVFLRYQINAIEDREVPGKFVLYSPAPNPSVNNVIIKYGLPDKANVSLNIYDMSGRLVKALCSGLQDKGYHTVNLGKDELAKGVYFVKFASGSYRATQKLVLMR